MKTSPSRNQWNKPSSFNRKWKLSVKFFCFFQSHIWSIFRDSCVHSETPRSKSSGPFKLDQAYISEIESDWVRSEKWEKGQMSQVNLDFLHSPLKSCEVNGVSYPADRLQRLISNSATHVQVPGQMHNYTSPQRNMTVSSPNTPKWVTESPFFESINHLIENYAI